VAEPPLAVGFSFSRGFPEHGRRGPEMLRPEGEREVLVPGLTSTRHLSVAVPRLRQTHGFHRRQVMFRGVTERCVPGVVQQAGEAQDLIAVIEVRFGKPRERFRLRVDQAPETISGEVHDAERVLETVVDRPRVDQRDEAELADVPQALDPGMINDRTLVRGDEDGAVDGVADFVGLGHVRASSAGNRGGVGLVLGMAVWAMGIYKPIDRNSGYDAISAF